MLMRKVVRGDYKPVPTDVPREAAAMINDMLQLAPCDATGTPDLS